MFTLNSEARISRRADAAKDVQCGIEQRHFTFIVTLARTK
jgi:hypothetical protein